MKTNRKSSKRRLQSLLALVWLWASLTAQCSEPGEVILHLKNGDRLTGRMLSEDDERIILTTPWNTAIFVPKTEINRREIVTRAAEQPGTAAAVGTTNRPAAAPTTTVVAETTAAPRQQPPAAKKPAVKKRHELKWNVKLGTDLTVGAKDVQNYFGQITLTYGHNYHANPKRFLRNTLDYRVQYGKTDSQVTANRMVGSDKLDFDIGSGFYGYNSMGAGYDQPRKIAFQYEIGPGLGYHLVTLKTYTLDTEIGLNYQSREGLNSSDREVLQLRLGQTMDWQIMPKLTLSERFELLPFLTDSVNYQFRLEGNLGVGIVSHLSLNFTVLNLYDTEPEPNVPQNEFQFRSSLGIHF